MRSIRTFLLILGLVCVIPLSADEAKADPRVAPGKSFWVEYPDMPQTLAKTQAKMQIMIPNDYSPEKKHPLFIWFNGGKGGPGAGTARAITGGKRFVCASFPLFKKNTKKPGIWGTHLELEDVDLIWPQFKIMLEDLKKIVPNINWEVTIAGGFSNGAHCTALLIEGTDGEWTDYIQSFFFCEGGYDFKNYNKVPDDRAVLWAWGEKSLKERLSPVPDAAAASGLRTRGIEMKGVGHACPKEYFDEFRTWVIDEALLGKIPGCIEQSYEYLRQRRYADAVRMYSGIQQLADEFGKYQNELDGLLDMINKLSEGALKKANRMRAIRERDKKRKIEKLSAVASDWPGTEAGTRALELIEQIKSGIVPEKEKTASVRQSSAGNKPAVDPAQEKQAKVYWDMAQMFLEKSEYDQAKTYFKLIMDRCPRSSFAEKAEAALKKI